MACKRMAIVIFTATSAQAWNECAFPDVGYYMVDEGIGISFAYGATGMNGKLYNGGYMKGHLGFVGVTDTGVVEPEPAATLWGDADSDIQHLYVAEIDAAGKMAQSWFFKSSNIQVGSPGHGRNGDRVQVNGVQAMLDDAHLSVKGDFRYTLTMPDGTTQYTAPTRSAHGSTRLNTVDPVQFVMKLDVSKVNGVGTGTTGWVAFLDDLSDASTHSDGPHLGGVKGNYDVNIHGDETGDMIVTYTGCSGWDAAADGTDSYGRTVPNQGAGTGCKHYLIKLNAADGTVKWRKETSVLFDECRAVTGGDFFCVYQMEKGDASRAFGNGTTVPSYANHVASRRRKLYGGSSSAADYAVLLKYNTDGDAQWAKVTHDQGLTYSQRNLGASADGSVLAIAGTSKVSRINTDGTILWTDDNGGGGTGGHGYRGLTVIGTDDGTTDTSEIVVHGSLQEGSPTTLKDSGGKSITLRSRGSYSIFVASFNGADGLGKWAIDGGSSGLDYFFAFGSDTSDNSIYVGGGVYDTPEFFQWGDVRRTNPVRAYVPDPAISGYAGTTKGFTVKIKTTTTKPACLDTCTDAIGPAPADVKAGHCYIDRHCYADGDFAPYPGEHCMKCDPTASTDSKVEWSGPDTTSHCFIGGKCLDQGTHAQIVVSQGRRGPVYGPDPCNHCDWSSSTSEYTAINGCLLNMASFTGGAFYINGSSLPDSLQPDAVQSLISSHEQQAAADQAQISSLQDRLQDGINADLAIALIAVMGSLFVLVLLILAILIRRERQGMPIFLTSIAPGKVSTSSSNTQA